MSYHVEVLTSCSFKRELDCFTLSKFHLLYFPFVLLKNRSFCRTIGKASSEMRIYSSAPKKHLFDNLLESQENQASNFEGSLNIRASYFAGQEVYGDAILASVGYTWRSSDLFRESVSLSSYYR